MFGKITMDNETIILIVVLFYLAVVLSIGMLAFRRSKPTPEDYFLGGRLAKSIVLFMSLLGTNITPFLIMGISGLAYHHGYGVFGYTAAMAALIIPVAYYFIGYPAWIASKTLKALTPAELLARRLACPNLGRLLFFVYFIYMLPYISTGVAGVGLAVDVFTQQAISFEIAAAGILVITLIYTCIGGMRATMWTNVFQGLIFGLFLYVSIISVAQNLGGLTGVMQEVVEKFPELTNTKNTGLFSTGSWFVWGMAMGLVVLGFPHILVRVFAAKDVTSLKNSIKYYPIIMIGLMLVATLFGVWGRLEFPDFIGRESDKVFPMVIRSHFGPIVQGLALAGILAAVMSTLDAQMLTLSSMLTRDVWYGLSKRSQVILGRLFLVILGCITYYIVILRPDSIFAIAQLSFSGFVTLTPIWILGLHWKKFTASAAIASIVTGNIVLIVFFNDWISSPGLIPVAWSFLTASVTGILVSFFTSPPPEKIIKSVMDPIKRAMAE
tara:strand:- start:123403 stop:124887 length:1485 start_codon:yes stop_codon:yes gene_type:complete